jgi:ribosomal protein S18 acetylase RimI-like enzyme
MLLSQDILDMSEVEVRDAYLEDVPFIFATMLRSYRHASTFARKISNEIFYKYHHMFLEACLSRANSKVMVAHAKGEPNVILGYLLSETRPDGEEVVHYTYVKKSFRQMGVAKALWATLDKSKYTITHYTMDADWIMRKFSNLTYNPYLL